MNVGLKFNSSSHAIFFLDEQFFCVLFDSVIFLYYYFAKVNNKTWLYFLNRVSFFSLLGVVVDAKNNNNKKVHYLFGWYRKIVEGESFSSLTQNFFIIFSCIAALNYVWWWLPWKILSKYFCFINILLFVDRGKKWEETTTKMSDIQFIFFITGCYKLRFFCEI